MKEILSVRVPVDPPFSSLQPIHPPLRALQKLTTLVPQSYDIAVPLSWLISCPAIHITLRTNLVTVGDTGDTISRAGRGLAGDVRMRGRKAGSQGRCSGVRRVEGGQGGRRRRQGDCQQLNPRDKDSRGAHKDHPSQTGKASSESDAEEGEVQA